MQHPLKKERDEGEGEGERGGRGRERDEKITRPVWCDLKSNNTSRISFRILVIHDSKAQVVIDKIFLLLAL